VGSGHLHGGDDSGTEGQHEIPVRFFPEKFGKLLRTSFSKMHCALLLVGFSVERNWTLLLGLCCLVARSHLINPKEVTRSSLWSAHSLSTDDSIIYSTSNPFLNPSVSFFFKDYCGGDPHRSQCFITNLVKFHYYSLVLEFIAPSVKLRLCASSVYRLWHQ
jgi:hypothetical protein